MDWFKRYGIPGAYSMGLTFMWLAILYPCKVKLHNEDTLKILGGIFAGGFLPFGYLMCMVGNAYYFFRCCFSSRYGRHARARHIAKTNSDNNNIPVNINEWARWARNGIKDAEKNLVLRTPSHRRETVLAACSVLQTVSRKDFDLKGDEHVQEWIRKRNDIVVVNQAIMAGTIVCTGGFVCLNFLPDWWWQPNEHWYVIFTSIILFCLFAIILYVTSIVRMGIDIVIAGMFHLHRIANSEEESSGTVGT